MWVIGLIIAAIACLGFGFGLWSQNFSTAGPVSTGSFNVVFSSFTAPSPTLGATFSVYQQDSHTCDISLNDLYPTCNPTFNFTLQDTGTIPAKITDVKINGTSIVSGGSLNTTNIDLDGDGKTDITISVTGIAANSQIGANNGTLPGTLTVNTWSVASNGNDATANAGGSFTFEIDTAQNP
jgi:hypothetical protein